MKVPIKCIPFQDIHYTNAKPQNNYMHFINVFIICNRDMSLSSEISFTNPVQSYIQDGYLLDQNIDTRLQNKGSLAISKACFY